SFAFIGGVIAVTGYAGGGANANIGVALGAIIACGVVYTIIGLIVWWINARSGDGSNWIDNWMPPVVTGSIVAVIG
ncbi:MAG TPA: pyrimidine utilization transport protein G, partial [Pusillimonas sp.]|nr:pyrimidine utilization transport protein G [Pusillimonas sp.]